MRSPACPRCGQPQVALPGRGGQRACVLLHGIERESPPIPDLRKRLPFSGDRARTQILVDLGREACASISPGGLQCEVGGLHTRHEVRDDKGCFVEVWYDPAPAIGGVQ